MRLLLLALVLSLPLASALPTPGLNGALTQQTLGRVFPEPLQTNDYVSYGEAVAGLALLDAQAPDWMEVVPLGESTGWVDVRTGKREPTTMYAVEVTNEKSAQPKRTLVFFLSIHGNEKGGREGGLRVIEDFAMDRGLSKDEPDLRPMLDGLKLVFIFANNDGWTHEEAQYKASDASSRDQFTRGNGNKLDLNRQFPTTGYMDPDHTPLSESESRAMLNYTRTLTNVVAGADVHGIVRNVNLVRLLLKDGEKTQQALFDNERLAEAYKERLNANPHYAGWEKALDVRAVCCGAVAEWAATFDAIGYSASGTAGAWIVQQHGLDAPGYTVEFAYNHYLMDAYYPGAGAVLNDYHVEAVRDNVATFMRFAAEPMKVRLDAQGRVVVLQTPAHATSADDDPSKLRGWFVESDADDDYDVLHKGYAVSPNAFFEQLGVVELTESPAPRGDTFVVPGAAATRVRDVQALRAFVEAGGDLVLTDEALPLLELMGLVDAGAVGSKEAYSGYSDLVDRQHALTEGLRGFPRQTYDPNPLGFAPGTSPVWFVDRAAWEAAGGVTVGAVAKTGSGAPVVERPEQCDEPRPRIPLYKQRVDHDHFGEARLLTLDAPLHLSSAGTHAAWGRGVDCADLDATNLGVLDVGAGRVLVFGAILPAATEAAEHPYGLDDHAVAVAGNRILLRMMGLDVVATPRPAADEVALAGGADVPFLGAAGLVTLALAVATLRRRR